MLTPCYNVLDITLMYFTNDNQISPSKKDTG
jgi:hypothetical protein